MRDHGLEELVNSSLGNVRGVAEKAMFGGWAWLIHGNLLCGARQGSLMLRVGPGNESWALEIPGVIPVIMRGHRMNGYVRATLPAYSSDAVRQKLIEAALPVNSTLPKKPASAPASTKKKKAGS
jgi:TfoX N-terminal domain